MDYYNQPKEENYNNCCKHRFLCFFCKSYEVDKGWGCGICGCRTFSFSFGIILFASIYLIISIKDFIEIAADKDLKNENFKIIFMIKILADVLCILGSIFGLASIWSKSYCQGAICYHIVAISFLVNGVFCILLLLKLKDYLLRWDFAFYRITNTIIWGVAEYWQLIYAWICFCNKVDIKRKKDEQQSKNPYNFGF